MQDNKDKKIKLSRLIFPIILCLLGITLCIICAPMTKSVNGGVGLGLIILMIGTIILFSQIYKEIYRIGIETPFPLNKLFPNYPVVEDTDKTGESISGFRGSVNEFLTDSSIKQNSRLQDYSSQLLWHSFYLWKNRLIKKGLILKLEASRRAYTSKKNSIRTEEYFDGRYEVKDVSEEIDAARTFIYKGHEIEKLRDKEIAHYTLLSAKQTQDGKYVCPNCGSPTTRNNLIDGCDYCDTRFTVEDIENSVASFGYRRDFSVSNSKKEAVKSLIYPWVFLITEMPYVYFGFFGAFLYMDENVFARLITGIVAAGLFGLFGWFFVKINMAIVAPIVLASSAFKDRENRKLIYRSKEAFEQEKKIAEYVRGFDSKFSIQSFFSGIQNKLYAIHFADNREQINAFSDVDLSSFLAKYKNVVDIDIISMTMCSYEMLEGNHDMPDGIQNSMVRAELVLRDFIGGHIHEKEERLELHLSKNGRCRTQAVCGPSLMKCSGCGRSISLMEGKKCEYCGHELDMKKYDWTITDYKLFA